ncbi:MAG TPA: response regulator transcription factor [Chitinophagaceae bacterium]|nr:response regulator transcription factor [Chitinophagaceae bacterium]
MKAKHRVLLVEDDDSFGYILKEYLLLYQFDVIWTKDGLDAIKKIRHDDFDICILDFMLPGADGFDVAANLIEVGNATPFIFLTAKSLKIDKLKGFRVGCDDYEVKPVDEEILLAKIQAILNRSAREKQDTNTLSVLDIGSYKYDVKNQILSYKGIKKILTDKEADLLKLLYANRNQLLERKKVLREVWGIADLFSRKSMDVFISRLRKYLSNDPNVRIINVHNKGFILQILEKNN